MSIPVNRSSSAAHDAIMPTRPSEAPWADTCRRLREALGWTRQDLAERSGVHAQTLLALERGENVTAHTILLVARGLGVPMATLCGEHGGLSEVELFQVRKAVEAAIREHAKAIAARVADLVRGHPDDSSDGSAA